MRDHGAQCIAEAMSKNNNITFLDVSSNRITTTGVAALAKALRLRLVGCIVALSCNLLRDQLTDEIDAAIAGGKHDDSPRNTVEYITALEQHSLSATPAEHDSVVFRDDDVPEE